MNFKIEDLDQVEFDDFFQSINQEENTEVCPSSRMEARKWIMSLLKIEGEIDYLNGEYKKELKKRYIQPVEDKIEKLEKNAEYIRDGLLSFLKNAETNSVSFPEYGTVYKVEGREKIIYPENEEEFAETLKKSGYDNFVRTKLAIDKKAIQKYFSEKEELPVAGLSVEKTMDSVRIKKLEKDK